VSYPAFVAVVSAAEFAGYDGRERSNTSAIKNPISKIGHSSWILLDKDNISYYLSIFYQICEPVA
jgi:hypothetical protein